MSKYIILLMSETNALKTVTKEEKLKIFTVLKIELVHWMYHVQQFNFWKRMQEKYQD